MTAFNGDGSSSASRCGRVTIISNMRSTAVDSHAPTLRGSPLLGKVRNDVVLRAPAPYASDVQIPLLGQLKDGVAATSGIIADDHYQWSLVTGSAPERAGGYAIRKLSDFFDGYRQVFVENASGAEMSGAIIRMDGVYLAVPPLKASEVWTTTISMNAQEKAPVIMQAYRVVFNANGGVGTMGQEILETGRVYNLPRCTFTAPTDKMFKGWAGSNGRRYDDGVLVFNAAAEGATLTLTAIWE